MALADLIPSHGPAAPSVSWSVTRELTEADIIGLLVNGEPSEPVAAPALKKLTALHHKQAQLLARGISVKDVALATGRHPVSLAERARNDPAFRDLVSYYQSQRADAEIETTQRIQLKLADTAEQAVDEIAERVGDPVRRAKMKGYELIKIAELGLDRSVAPPKTAIPVGNVAPPVITLNFGTIPARAEGAEPEALKKPPLLIESDENE